MLRGGQKPPWPPCLRGPEVKDRLQVVEALAAHAADQQREREPAEDLAMGHGR